MAIQLPISIPFRIAQGLDDTIILPPTNSIQVKLVKITEFDKIIFEIRRQSYNPVVPKYQQTCLALTVKKNSDQVKLSQLSIYSDCNINGQPLTFRSGAGSALLKLAIKFSQEVLNASAIYLIDASHVFCLNKDQYVSVDLPIIMLLTQASTWYGKFGFVPIAKKDNLLYQVYIDTILKAHVGDLSNQLQQDLSPKIYDQNMALTDYMKIVYHQDCYKTSKKAVDIFVELGFDRDRLVDFLYRGEGWILFL